MTTTNPSYVDTSGPDMLVHRPDWMTDQQWRTVQEDADRYMTELLGFPRWCPAWCRVDTGPDHPVEGEGHRSQMDEVQGTDARILTVVEQFADEPAPYIKLGIVESGSGISQCWATLSSDQAIELAANLLRAAATLTTVAAVR